MTSLHDIENTKKYLNENYVRKEDYRSSNLAFSAGLELAFNKIKELEEKIKFLENKDKINTLELTAQNITDMYVTMDQVPDYTNLPPLNELDIVRVNMSKDSVQEGIQEEIDFYERNLKRLNKLKEENK